jgi:phosphoribosylamine--glycine ligase
VIVVGAAEGYPGSYEKGMPLSLPLDSETAWIIHAGTAWRGEQLVTAGGRVFGAVGQGDSLVLARRTAYALMSRVPAAGLHFRRDIGGPLQTAEGSV